MIQYLIHDRDTGDIRYIDRESFLDVMERSSGKNVNVMERANEAFEILKAHELLANANLGLRITVARSTKADYQIASASLS